MIVGVIIGAIFMVLVSWYGHVKLAMAEFGSLT